MLGIKETIAMTDAKITRRSALRATALGVVAIGAAAENAWAAAAAAKALPALAPTDPAAKALGYVEDATKVDAKANPLFKKGQDCANCLQWDEKTAMPQGKCKIFPGKLVKATGWCKVYVKKP
jgi:hypothetical protein